jgi:DNA-binding transcriptional ArsR family regulator
MQHVAELAKAVSDPGRLRILKMLEAGELCVCQITAVLGLATPTVSAHLAQLRRAGLLAQRRDGRWVHYRLADAAGDSDAGRLLAWALDALDGDATCMADRAVLAEIARTPLEALCAPAGGEKPKGKKKESA